MNKKNTNNKGFTLVELIVVLVILAILAAILVPALLGYIDRAREKQYVLNAKSYLTATQAEFSSLYGEGKKPSAMTGTRLTTVQNTADAPADTFIAFVGKDAVTDANKSSAISSNHSAYTVLGAYYSYQGVNMVYDGTAWNKVDSYSVPSIPDPADATKTLELTPYAIKGSVPTNP